MPDQNEVLTLTEQLLCTPTGVELFKESPEDAFDYCNKWAIAITTQQGFEETLDAYFKLSPFPSTTP